MGFVILVAMAVYLLLSLGVVAGAISYAKKNSKSIKKWGWVAALVMYMIPFWDWIPTIATHQFYCANDAGLKVNKTPAQWKAENPGVIKGLTTQRVPNHKFEGSGNDFISTTFWNSRIKSIHKYRGPIFLHVWRREDVLIDIKTDEILALYVDYSTSHERRQAGWSGWKFWLASDECIGGRNKAIRFVEFVNQLKGSEK